MTLEEIKAQAEAEVAKEDHRAKIEEEKKKIRLRKKHWLFPWRLRLINLAAGDEIEGPCYMMPNRINGHEFHESHFNTEYKYVTYRRKL